MPSTASPVPRPLPRPPRLRAAGTHLLSPPPVLLHPQQCHPPLFHRHLHLPCPRTDRLASLPHSLPALLLYLRHRLPSPPGSLLSTPTTPPFPNRRPLLRHLHPRLTKLPHTFQGIALQVVSIHRPLLTSTLNRHVLLEKALLELLPHRLLHPS